MAREIRFAAGTENGFRSTVWKLYAGSDDSVYLQSRMMGSDTKISLHKSGECHWARTDDWVKKNLDKVAGNSDRFLHRWSRKIPSGTVAELTFRLIVPASELRIIGEENRLEKVQWLPRPENGQSLAVELYFTPSVNGELDKSHFPHTPLVDWPLGDSSRFIAMYQIEEINPMNLETLEGLRANIRKGAYENNITIQPQFRGIGFFVNDCGYRGAIEVVPFQN